MKRAITLAGNKATIGLTIGTLKKLCFEEKMQFDIWSTASSSSMVSTAYHQAMPEKSTHFLEKLFSPSVLNPDHIRLEESSQFWIQTFLKEIGSLSTSQASELPHITQTLQNSVQYVMDHIYTPPKSHVSGLTTPLLYSSFFLNPMTFFLMNTGAYRSSNGLTQNYYQKNKIANQFDFQTLYKPDKPAIYHNAYNLTDHKFEIFDNKGIHQPITEHSLYACSSLPFTAQSVSINGKEYCESTAIHATNFTYILQDHPDIQEIWVTRILDRRATSNPQTLSEALNNLITLFTTLNNEKDFKLLKLKIKKTAPHIKIIEIPLICDFDTPTPDFYKDISRGYNIASDVLHQYRLMQNTNISRVA